MTFLKILEKTLLRDERFVAEDGKVLKAKVYDAAMAMDEVLLHLLLSEEVLRGHFFKKVNDTLIFDKIEFTWVLNSREFLPDSYTMYKNKIGLVDGSGDLISQTQDVTLVWPYKDCVLEGDQTKDDEKRNEVFYNETLAPDQVTRLLYPKALTNTKRYSYSGGYDLTGKAIGGEGTVTCEETTEFKDNGNLIIKGNNLLALSSLLRRYEGKVKLIYIDPPYNTGNDSFGYNDSFNHSTWLTFMKNRLEMARRLLSNNGMIFIQVDNNEMAYLKVLMDDLFGKENFINDIIWRRKGGSVNPQNRLNNMTDFILWYSKTNNYSINQIFSLCDDETLKYIEERFNKTEENGRRYRLSPIISPTYSRSLCYEYKGYKPPKNGWSLSKNKMKEFEKEDRLYFPEDKNQRIQRKQFLDEYKGRPIGNLWTDINVINPMSKESLDFVGQKPEYLIKRVIELASNAGDLILDCFSGTCTTLAVAMKMNRRFIGIEQMDYINTASVPRLCKVIEGEQGGISKDVDWSGGGSFVYCELAGRSEILMEQLQSAQDSDSILAILDKATEKGLLRPSVLPDDLKKTREDFLEFSLDEQRRLVMELLDKNKLYVNLCDIEDENMGLSESSKAFTRSFYSLDRDTEV